VQNEIGARQASSAAYYLRVRGLRHFIGLRVGDEHIARLHALADASFEGVDYGRLIFSGSGRGYDRTIGDVIVYSSSGPSHPNRDHEMAHTDQHTVLGPFYGPVHLGAQAISWATTGTYDQGNPLEWGPNQSPPTPWGF
jgi:hypothetical protein